MDSIEQTLRKAREVQERYKQFLVRKTAQDISMKETYAKIDRTQEALKSTRETIGKIDQLYENYQAAFSKVIDTAVSSLQTNLLFNVADADFKPLLITEREAAKRIASRKKIIFLTGAGISAASGIPTFRGANGFWEKENNEEDLKTPEEILTNKYYGENSFKTWAWLDNFYELKVKCEPNKGHQALSSILEELKKRKVEACIVTQNIDNYHNETQMARSKKEKQLPHYDIYEIHGNITKIRCQKCSLAHKALVSYPYEDYRKMIAKRETPQCPKCKDSLRPHIMFFDEFYLECINQSETISAFMADADLLVVVGTALQTGLASGLVQKSLERGIEVLQFNVECTIRRQGVAWCEGKAEITLEKTKFQLWKQK